ncbi:unnamed protein product [Mucor fragilis]
MSAQQRESFPSLDGQQAGTTSQGRMPPKDECHPSALTAKMVNNGVSSNVDRNRMEKKDPSLKRMQKNQVKRKTRLKKFYQRKVVNGYCGRKGSCITFTGSHVLY